MQYRKTMLTLLVAVLGYKLMATALPLMNKPSDADLYGGAVLLVFAGKHIHGTTALMEKELT